MELGKVIGANKANKMEIDQIQKKISNLGNVEKKNSFTNYKIQDA
jgi:TfoX/Sxy family transcriptional regulator of competence genes